MEPQIRVNMNADMGEGFGAYDIGNDEAILSIIGSASIACGKHAGDPNVMYRVVERAHRAGVSIGAHPGFDDLWGFGRRRIDMAPRDLELLVAYQLGALQAIASYFDEKVTHLKPHGALNNMAAEMPDYAMAVGRAIRSVDSSVIYVALAGSEMERAGNELGLRVACEAFVDRLYDDDGNLASRKIPGTVITDPAVAAERTVMMVRDQVVFSTSGKQLPRHIDTLCVHGDEPTAYAVASETRRALEAAGILLVPLPELIP